MTAFVGHYTTGNHVVGERPWTEQAACRGMDPDLWYPPRGAEASREAAIAKAVCASCPVAEPCLAWALQAHELSFGIFGGKTVEERQRIWKSSPQRLERGVA